MTPRTQRKAWFDDGYARGYDYMLIYRDLDDTEYPIYTSAAAYWRSRKYAVNGFVASYALHGNRDAQLDMDNPVSGPLSEEQQEGESMPDISGTISFSAKLLSEGPYERALAALGKEIDTFRATYGGTPTAALLHGSHLSISLRVNSSTPPEDPS